MALVYVCASCQVPISRDGGHCDQCGYANPPAMRFEQQGTFPAQPTPFSTDIDIAPSPSVHPDYPSQHPSSYKVSEGYQQAAISQRVPANVHHAQPAQMQRATVISQAPMQQDDGPFTTLGLETPTLGDQPAPTNATKRKPSGPSLRGRAVLISFRRRPIDSHAALEEQRAKSLAAVKAEMMKSSEAHSGRDVDHDRPDGGSNFEGGQGSSQYREPPPRTPQYSDCWAVGNASVTYHQHGREHSSDGKSFTDERTREEAAGRAEEFYQRVMERRAAEGVRQTNYPGYAQRYSAPWDKHHVPVTRSLSPQYHHEQHGSGDQLGRSGNSRMGQRFARGGNDSMARSSSRPATRGGIQKRYRRGPQVGQHDPHRRHLANENPNPSGEEEKEDVEAVDSTGPQRVASDSIQNRAAVPTQSDPVCTMTRASAGQVLSANDLSDIATRLGSIQLELTEITERLRSSIAAQSTQPPQGMPDTNSSLAEGSTLPMQQRHVIVKQEDSSEDNQSSTAKR